MQNNFCFNNLRIVISGNYKGLVFYKNKNKFEPYYKSKLTNDFKNNIIHENLIYKSVELKDMLLYNDGIGNFWQLNNFEEKHQIILLPIICYYSNLFKNNKFVLLQAEMNRRLSQDILKFDIVTKRSIFDKIQTTYSKFIIKHYCSLVETYYRQFTKDFIIKYIFDPKLFSLKADSR